MRQVGKPTLKTLIASNTVTSTGNSSTFAIPVADSYSFILNVTAASGTSPTFDAVFQTSIDNGTTFINVPWRFTQVTATTTNWLMTRFGLGVGEVGSETAVAATGGTLVKPAVVDPGNMQLKYTIAGTSPSFTFVLYLFSVGNGATVIN